MAANKNSKNVKTQVKENTAAKSKQSSKVVSSAKVADKKPATKTVATKGQNATKEQPKKAQVQSSENKTNLSNTSKQAAQIKPAPQNTTKKMTNVDIKPQQKSEAKPVNSAKSNQNIKQDNKTNVEDKKPNKTSSGKGKELRSYLKQHVKGEFKNKNGIIAISSFGCVLLLMIAMIIGIVVQNQVLAKRLYANNYTATTTVGYSAEYLGFVARNIPKTTSNEGLPLYPKYGYTLKNTDNSALTTEQKNAIIAESVQLTGVGTWIDVSGRTRNTYDKIDKDGKLYLNGEPVMGADGKQRTLYKHSASVGMYLGDVSDKELGVIKRITMRPRNYSSYGVTGLYAPAGEVIKLEISQEDMEATGGLVVHIGQALYNGQSNNIWAAKNIIRMPNILNTLAITKNTAVLNNGVYTAYIGSYLGGPIYIGNEDRTFSVTITGAVNYSHFILGYTNEEEFDIVSKSSAPYFDLEVWNYGVLHSGPKTYAKGFSYDQLYDAAILWEKISLVSNMVRGENSKQGIVFLYDPFVAAGAAVAFPGRRSVNCPAGWMGSSLNYQSFIKSGAWGNMHEYNHNFQGWGIGDGGEVTNNALNLVSYTLFTKISSSRKLGAANDGLGGWNSYTNAPWALDQITANKFSNGRKGLALYATLLHSFGQDNFINMAKNSGGQSVDRWFNSCMNVTQYDMTYFIKDMLGQTVSADVLTAAANSGYPMYVPVASIYQTGVSYNYNGTKQYTQTMQPYVIEYGKDYVIDLSRFTTTGGVNASGMYSSGSVVLPNGFSYQITNITQPENGKITADPNDAYKFVFSPNKNLRSGKIYVTLKITKDDGAFEVDDVDLALEFEQSHELNKTMLQRTTYTYDAANMYEHATDAYEAGYAGYSSTTGVVDNKNSTQNSNTDIWDTSLTPPNQVMEVQGKLYVSEDGDYRIALRGRWDCAMYISTDGGKTYTLGANIVTLTSTNGSGIDFNAAPYNVLGTAPENKPYYTDLENLKAGSWVYFKVVMLTNNNGARSSFVGVGWGKHEKSTGTFQLDENGNPIVDESGNPVLTGGGEPYVNVEYASGYRSSYELINTKFETDYFHKRDYYYSYNDNKTIANGNVKVLDTNYQPWTKGVPADEDRFNINHLFDNDSKTDIHTHQDFYVSANNPFYITVDLGKTITANRMNLYAYSASNSSNIGKPTHFVLYGSKNGKDFEVMYTASGIGYSNKVATAVFDKDYSFRYYKLVATQTDNSRFVLSGLDFGYNTSFPRGTAISPDSDIITYKGKWSTLPAYALFGHVYIGQRWSTASFTFEGERLAVLSAQNWGTNFEVYIDGKKTKSIDVKEYDGEMAWQFISNKLKEGKHKVLVRCLGMANVEGFIVW